MVTNVLWQSIRRTWLEYQKTGTPERLFYLAAKGDKVEKQCFKHMILGEKSIGKLLPRMVDEAGINKENRELTNTSSKKYMVSKLMDACIPETEIIHITGHKDTRSLKEYNHVSTTHKRKLSN